MFGKEKSWILVVLYVFYRSGGKSVSTNKIGRSDTVALNKQALSLQAILTRYLRELQLYIKVEKIPMIFIVLSMAINEHCLF